MAAQQAATTGHAADKAREEAELETVAHEISEALSAWFEDHNRQADAEKIALPLSARVVEASATCRTRAR